MVKDIFSIECEECQCYNFSPIKCKSCWEKDIKKQATADLIKMIDDEIYKIKDIIIMCEGNLERQLAFIEIKQRLEELKQMLVGKQ